VTAESRFGAEPHKNGSVDSEVAPCSAKPPAIGAGGADVDAPAEPRTPFSYEDLFASGSPAISGSRGDALTAELTGRLADDLAAVSICGAAVPAPGACAEAAVPRPACAARSPLFRQEAVQFQQYRREWGDVALLQPLSTKMLTWFMAATALSLCAFLFTENYARKEIASGYLAPVAGTSKVFASQQGTIRAVYVSEGQGVEQSQPLLTIDTSQIANDGADVNSTMLEALATRKDLLTQQIAAQQERAASEQERLTSLAQGAEVELSQLQTQIVAQRERARLSEEAAQAGGELRGKGFMADVEVNRRRSAALEQKQLLSSLEQQLAARENQLTETRYALKQLPILLAEKIRSIRDDLSALDVRIAELDGRRAYVLRAPISGRVSTLQATVGQYAEPRRLQMEIVPAKTILQAELFVPTRAIGFVEPGQKIRIMYEAFPYQHYGTYSGRITRVSQTIVTAADAAGPLLLKEPAYRVTATVDQPEIEAKGRKIPLQPDMLLRADIILEERPLIQWLIEPLLSVRM
jgi:membrane fusion protein